MSCRLRAYSLWSTLLVSTAALASADTYDIDPSRTTVTFEAGHFATSVNRGRFEKYAGTLSIDRVAKTGHVEVTIDTGSITTGVVAFDDQLKGKDFFNTESYPTATFVGNTLLFKGDKLVGVRGSLTLLGISQPMTIKALSYSCSLNAATNREVCGGNGEATLQRSAFGMGFALPLIPDDITLLVKLEAVKQ